jgi:hypothetical protein
MWFLSFTVLMDGQNPGLADERCHRTDYILFISWLNLFTYHREIDQSRVGGIKRRANGMRRSPTSPSARYHVSDDQRVVFSHLINQFSLENRLSLETIPALPRPPEPDEVKQWPPPRQIPKSAEC